MDGEDDPPAEEREGEPGMISGAERLIGGYWAFATVDPATGQVTLSSGVEDPFGSFVDFQPLLDSPLTVGPDGEVYWMRLLEDGLHIYRR